MDSSSITTVSSSPPAHSLPDIPVDLILQIAKWFNPKTIGRFRCVSKLWRHLLGGQLFIDMNLDVARNRQRLLFLVVEHDHTSTFYSVSEKHDQMLGAPIVSLKHHSIDPRSHISSQVRGLLCINRWDWVGHEQTCTVAVYNPTTCESMVLPSVQSQFRRKTINFIGFDQLTEAYKVISPTSSINENDDTARVHQVLTLQNLNLVWRAVQGSFPFQVADDYSICVGGYIYFFGCIFSPQHEFCVIGFNLERETFMYIRRAGEMDLDLYATKIFDYKDRLALMSSCWIPTGETFEFWIFENEHKHEWTRHIRILPPLWKSLVNNDGLIINGITCYGDLVLSYFYREASQPFELVYWNIDSGLIDRFEIQGLQITTAQFEIQLFFNYYEYIGPIIL